MAASSIDLSGPHSRLSEASSVDEIQGNKSNSKRTVISVAVVATFIVTGLLCSLCFVVFLRVNESRKQEVKRKSGRLLFFRDGPQTCSIVNGSSAKSTAKLEDLVALDGLSIETFNKFDSVILQVTNESTALFFLDYIMRYNVTNTFNLLGGHALYVTDSKQLLVYSNGSVTLLDN